ncbi:MAG: Cys-tRNA(Pro) deacylase [Propionibacteriaceae bacterium]|jgi:Cys-tRNA(Pro)/Cys-tRNA(Cys) deacylase|nr:Cys-tRNA(Pro) deacylase [Propionibacteriaceae bacterium]
MAKKTKTGTPALQALTQAGVDHRVHEYEHDPQSTGFGDESVAQLGLDPRRVFKTLLAEVERTGRSELVVAIVPVAGQLDLKALAGAVGAKRAQMADPAAAERATGYVVGGISPFGQRQPHPTVLDASALDFTTVFVSAGRRGSQVELAPADLMAQTQARLAPIGRPSHQTKPTGPAPA